MRAATRLAVAAAGSGAGWAACACCCCQAAARRCAGAWAAAGGTQQQQRPTQLQQQQQQQQQKLQQERRQHSAADAAPEPARQPGSARHAAPRFGPPAWAVGGAATAHPAPAPQQHQHQQQQQAPDAPGTPARPSRPQHAAAAHLAAYLASVGGGSFVEDLAAGIRAGSRLSIARALTLCESTRPDHALQAAALLRKLVDDTQQHRRQQRQPREQQQERGTSLPGGAAAAAAAAAAHARRASSLRIGVSGPPGAGKSSLIEAWGCYLADHGSRVAVLAVDPSSAESGGAILGDKTRMARLSSHPNAFVRPSPARGTLGGVSRSTYDAMVVCEAAGYDRVLVETVGVGQSEVAVADLVDCVTLVMPPVGGDELQVIKRGIMEVADVVVVNKADGATEAAAGRAAAEFDGALHLMPHRYRGWEPQVLAVSAHTGKNVPALARLVGEFEAALEASGELEKCRVRRAEAITWLSLEEQLLEGLRADAHTRWLMARLMPMVRAGAMAPRSAADIALSHFLQHAS
ncbi:hypothetical protein HT031_001153 [Scenedesmus sp. PABB004]|nr:hypothetical protein HT031_001153 [Scenedesmus sp. PABB004]